MLGSLKRSWKLLGVAAATFLATAAAHSADLPEHVRGIYLTTGRFGESSIKDTIHAAKHVGLNAVVLHVKDPFGHVHWKSTNAVAKEIGAIRGKGRLEKAVKLLKAESIWTIAKLDLFQDTLLAEKKPAWAVQDTETGKPWLNKRKLGWGNPYDGRVWDYNIALAKELAALGVDEIQFDYIRFPSDGNLKRIRYPKTREGMSKIQTIGAFLKKARSELNPVGAKISVDLFGFVAWKTDDFGVGQRIEEIAPHVDAICPMLYPSHFPKGFLGKKDPSDHPREIMELSVKKAMKRTKTDIRPWIQGFWYKPKDITAQLDGIKAAGGKSWLVWNPSANYSVTYEALAKQGDKKIPARKRYPTLEDLAKNSLREVKGARRPVLFVNYELGYCLFNLEGPKDGKPSPYGTPTAVLSLFDQAIMDHILETRGVTFSKRGSKTDKVRHLTRLLCKDLGVSARSIPSVPILVHWMDGCHFTKNIPEKSEGEEQAAPKTAEADLPAE